MCKGSDVVENPLAIAAAPFMAGQAAFARGLMPKAPNLPQVVREDPAAQQAKIESDAAQAAQGKTLEQRKRARANSLLSRAGGVGDTSTAEVATPTVTGKPNLGA